MIFTSDIFRQFHLLNTQNTIRLLGIILVVIVVTYICGYTNYLTRRQIVAIRLLVFYSMILFCATVLCRNEGIRRYRLDLFWSWKAVIEINRTDLIYENLLNIFMFIPIGYLLSECFKIRSNRIFFLVILIGIVTSGLIEVSQLVMKCGLCEVDDIVHNTIGCAIGYFIRSLIYICKKNDLEE